jgi:hypothetical protein
MFLILPTHRRYVKCFGRSFVFLRRASSPFAPQAPEWAQPNENSPAQEPKRRDPQTEAPFLFFPSDSSSPSIQNLDKEVRASLRRRRSLQLWRAASLRYQPPVPASTDTAVGGGGRRRGPARTGASSTLQLSTLRRRMPA